MALGRWRKVRQEFEVKNPWWMYRKDNVLLPSGKNGEYHFVHTNGASMVIPVLNDGRIIMVNQYRYLLDKESLEFPCGGIKDGSSYEETAAHELSEETGFISPDVQCVAEFNPFNGVTDEICKVFTARNLQPVESRHDETEEFEQLRVSPQELDAKIRSGEVWDGMTLAAWALTRHHFVKLS